MFGRQDPTGIQIEIRAESMQSQAVHAALRNDILLPGVVLVGRKYSVNHPNAKQAFTQHGEPLTVEKRRQIARERAPIKTERGDDWRHDGDGRLDHSQAQQFLPKSFRRLPKEEADLDLVGHLEQFDLARQAETLLNRKPS
jgi:hypothetical protein